MSEITGINFFEADASIIVPLQEGSEREYYIFATDFADDGPEEVVKVNTRDEFRSIFGNVKNKKIERLINYAFDNGWGVVFRRVATSNAYRAQAIFKKFVQRFDLKVPKTNIYRFNPNTQQFIPATLNIDITNNTNVAVLRNINLLDAGIETANSIIDKSNYKSIINSFKYKNAVVRITEDPNDPDNYYVSVYVLAPLINLRPPQPANILANFNVSNGGYVASNTKYWVYGVDTEGNYTNPVQFETTSPDSIVSITAYPSNDIESIVIFKETNNNLQKLHLNGKRFVDYGTNFSNTNTITSTYIPSPNFTVSYSILQLTSQTVSAGRYTYYVLLQSGTNYTIRYVYNINLNADTGVAITLSGLPVNTNFKIHIYRATLDPNTSQVNEIKHVNVNVINNIANTITILDGNDNIILNNTVYNYTVLTDASNNNITNIDLVIPDNVLDSVSNVSVVSERDGGITNETYYYRIVPYKVNNNIVSTGGVSAEVVAPALVSSFKNILSWQGFTFTGNYQEAGYYIYRYKKVGNDIVDLKVIKLKSLGVNSFVDYGVATWVNAVRPNTAVDYITIIISNSSSIDNTAYYLMSRSVSNTDGLGNVYRWGIVANTKYRTSRFNNTKISFVSKYNKISKQYDVSLVLTDNTEVPLFTAIYDNTWRYKYNNKVVVYDTPEFNEFVDELYYYILKNAKNYFITRDSLQVAFDFFNLSDGRLNLFGGRSSSDEIETPTTIIASNYGVFEDGDSGVPNSTSPNVLETELLKLYTTNNNALAEDTKTELLKTNLYRNLLLIYYPYFFSENFWDSINYPTYKSNAITFFNILRDVVETRGDMFIIAETPPVHNYDMLLTFNELIGYPDTSFVSIYTPSVIINNKRYPVGQEVVEKIIMLINTNSASLAPYGITNNGVINAQAVEKTFTADEYEQIYNILSYNPVIDFGADGILIRGLRTLYKKVSVLQNLHTRVLASIMKKKLYRIAFRYQGANITPANITNLMSEINLYLNSLVQSGQLYKFDPVKNLSTSTDIMQGKLKLKLTVYFTKQLETIDFYITFEGAGEIIVS